MAGPSRGIFRSWRVRVAFAALLVTFVTGGGTAFADTPVAGSLTGNQTWTKAGNPYVLVDNATVASGGSLTIEPGVQVTSDGRYTLNVVGRVQAVGSAADPIDISLGSGLRFYNGSAGSEVAWATVRDSIDFGISTSTGSNSTAGPWPSVHDVEFRNNRFAMYPWYPQGGTASVTHSRFIGNDYGLVGVGANFTIDQVLVESTSYITADLSNNAGQSWTITRSNLAPPTYSPCTSGGSGCTMTTYHGSYTATGIWWGTTDPFEINRRIYDGNDDPSRSVVSKDPIATSPYDLYLPSSAPAVGNGTIRPDIGSISGTATDQPTASTGIDHVTASVEDLTTHQWWHGSAWSGAETFRTATGTTSWQVNVPQLVGGHTYRVRSLAYDGAGNAQWGASSATFTVDGTAPDTSITSGPSGLTNSRSASFGFDSTETGSSFECKLDGPGAATGNYGSCGSTKDYSNLADGSYTFSVRATDPAGNTDPDAATHSFTVSTSSGSSDPGSSGSDTPGTTSPGSDTPNSPGDGSTTTGPVHTPKRCKVPKLGGKTLAAAKKALKNARCKVGKVTKRKKRHVKHGRVLTSTPRAGTRWAVGKKVALVLSK